MMIGPELIQLGVMIGGMMAAAALAFALAYPFLSGDYTAERRMKRVTESQGARKARVAHAEVADTRKRAVADSLKEIEQQQAKSKKLSLRIKLLRAGLDVSTNAFWLASAATGLILAVASYVLVPSLPIVAHAIFGFVGAFGLPRWVISFLTRRRQNKFLESFADAIDVIVRGVKTGLPINECLATIARESPEPVRSEFQVIVDQQRVGVPLAECLERLMSRMPLPEVRFFAIVVAIQQQAGGNLSEALGNLSAVLRARKQLAAKVRSLSAEAKASAWVLGCLPIVVMVMVYLTTPGYISILWTDKFGQFLLLCSGIWMSCGIFVMKRMIAFKY
jgi:tight adherence protein B